MPDLPLEEFRADVVSHLDLPDFAEIVRRDQRNRRRRGVVVASIVASVVVGTAVAFGNTSEPRSLEPAKPNGPEITSVDATELLAAIETTQEPATYRLNSDGDVLSSWTVQSGGGADECAMQHAFTWRSADGAIRNWLDPVGHRVILPLLGGFIVGGGEDPCEDKTRTADLTDLVYLVDSEGRRIEIEAIEAREDICARDIRLPECAFSVEGETLTRVPSVGRPGWRDPDGTHWWEEQEGTASLIRWARPGETLRQKKAPLLGGASLEVNGDVVFGPVARGFFRTMDHGRTWSTVDVSEALATVGCKEHALEWWTSTISGTFGGVCRSPEGRLLIRSTDVSWAVFEAVTLDGASQPLSVDSAGEWLIADAFAHDGFWVSNDQGVSWEFLSWKTLR